MVARTLLVASVVAVASATNVVLTNDDGWAVAIIRAQNDALKAAGYSVILSAPADNKSGTGSTSANPTPRSSPCQFNTCSAGASTGSNSSDARLNWVNAYPVDSARYGIQTLSPKIFGGAPDFVVSGPNVGQNTGSTTQVSGTVGAASEAAKEGIPAVAFSASSSSTDAVSYTTLTSSPSSSLTVSAKLYSALTVRFLSALFASGPVASSVPAGTILNVNYPATSSCSAATSFKFVLSRNLASSSATDVLTCGSSHLPSEASVVGTRGCYVSVSVLDASTKKDVSAAKQTLVYNRLQSVLSCLP